MEEDFLKVFGGKIKARDCYACIRCKRFCDEHTLIVRKAIQNIYKGPLDWAGFEQYSNFKSKTEKLNLRKKTYKMSDHVSFELAKNLFDFSNNYCDAYIEKERNLTLEYGNLGISFAWSNLPDLRTFGKSLLFVPKRKVDEKKHDFFTLGAIYFFPYSEDGDIFCCVFEDGTFFFCEQYDIDPSQSFRTKLMTLKKLLTDHSNGFPPEEEFKPSAPPMETEPPPSYDEAMQQSKPPSYDEAMMQSQSI